MDSSPPGSSVHGIFQARVLDGVAVSLPVSRFQGIFLTQGLNLGLLHCRKILSQLSHQGILGGPFAHLQTHQMWPGDGIGVIMVRLRGAYYGPGFAGFALTQ